MYMFCMTYQKISLAFTVINNTSIVGFLKWCVLETEPEIIAKRCF